MLKNFTNKLSTSLTIRLSENGKTRFINMAVKDGIRFWNYNYKDGFIYVCVGVDDYKKLRYYKKLTGVKITLIRKNGIPYKLRFLRKRKGLIFGLIFSVALYIYLSSCYWIIDVGTQGAYSDKEILDFIYENGLKIGSLKSNLDEEALSILLLLEFDELKWASINTYGCTVTIDLAYSDLKPEISTADDVSNVIASKAGIIRYVEATFGRITVEIGEAVSAGDILITGVWDENYDKDEWSQVEDPVLFETASRGIVLAETQNIITVSTPKIITEYIEFESYEKYSLGLFSLEIPFCFNIIPDGDYSYCLNENYLTLLGVTVPIYFNTEVLTKLETTEYLQDENTAKLILEELLYNEAYSSLDDNEELLNVTDIQFFDDENYYYMSCNCIFLEDISIVEQILVN